jgi:hypothetical protein
MPFGAIALLGVLGVRFARRATRRT